MSNMARMKEATARLGKDFIRTNNRKQAERTEGENNFPISTMTYNRGETKRLVIPSFDGIGVLILGERIHKVSSPGFLQRMGKKGPYNLFEVRCMNPKRQIGDDREKFAEEKCHCVFCELARMENRRSKEARQKAYESGQLEGATKDDFRAFYAQLNAEEKIRESYDSKNRKSITMQYIVALEVETETVEETIKGRVKRVTRAVADENGLPKYKLVYIKASDSMLKELKTEADQAFDTEALTEDFYYGYDSGLTDEEGNKEFINYSFVDFTMNYPKEVDKMTSARNRTLRATVQAQSIITPEFVEAIKARSEEIVKIAEDNFYKAVSTLAPLTEAEQIALMADGGAYYRDMVAKYGVNDDNRVEPTKLEDGTYSVQLTDAEWEDIAFRSITEHKPSRELEKEVKESILAKYGIDGVPFDPSTRKETKEQPAKKVAKKAVKADATSDDDTNPDTFFA